MCIVVGLDHEDNVTQTGWASQKQVCRPLGGAVVDLHNGLDGLDCLEHPLDVAKGLVDFQELCVGELHSQVRGKSEVDMECDGKGKRGGDMHDRSHILEVQGVDENVHVYIS